VSLVRGRLRIAIYSFKSIYYYYPPPLLVQLRGSVPLVRGRISIAIYSFKPIYYYYPPLLQCLTKRLRPSGEG